MYTNLIGRLYDTPLCLQGIKAEEIARAVTNTLFSGKQQTQDFDLAAQATDVQALESTGSSELAASSATAMITIVDALVTRAAPGSSGTHTSYDRISRQITAARAEGITNIGFIFHSPGGEAAGMTALASEIYALRKQGIRTFSYVEGNAASAAYALACATEQMYVTDLSHVGSIGALIIHADETAKDEKEGIKYEFFRSKDLKARGSSHESLSDEVRKNLHAKLAATDKIFNNLVTSYRPSVTLEVIQNLRGDTVQGSEAVSLGLADKVVSNFEEVLQLEMQYKSSHSVKSKGTRMTTKTEIDTQTGITQAEHDTAISAAVVEATNAERARILALMENGSTLKVPASLVAKAVTKGFDTETAGDIFTAYAETVVPPIDNVVQTTVVDDKTLGEETSQERVTGLLGDFAAATGRKFGGQV